MPITLRSVKGSPLTHNEVDANWGVVNLLTAGLVLASVAGAVGDGVANDTTPISAVMASDGVKVLGYGDYYTPGSVTAFTRPTLILADNAKESGTYIPFISITDADVGFKSQPQTYVFIWQTTSARADSVTMRVDRIVDTDDGLSNPKALRVKTYKQHSNTQTEWAISGELDNYSNTASSGETAVSGVANKYGLASVFAGHFQANELYKHTADTAVTGLIGAELNLQAVGLDHPTANAGYGNRRVLDIIARTAESVTNWNVNEGDNYGDAEIRSGVVIRTDNITDGYFKYGLVVMQSSGNPNSINTGVQVQTTGIYGFNANGNNSAASYHGAGTVPYGLQLVGTYANAAIQIPEASYMAMEASNVVKMAWGVTASVWGFYSGANERFGIVTSTGAIRINGLQVVGPRDTGWTADTGTAKKTANATYSGTASVGYVQAEMQAVMNAVRDATQTIKALKDAMISTHGLIGA